MKSGRRQPAWLCVLINLLAFPGLGTILAGRRAGYPQAVIMVAGFILATGYLILYLAAVVRYVRNPAWTESDFQALYRPYVWALPSGLTLCAAAWVWSFFSSLAIWRDRHRPDAG